MRWIVVGFARPRYVRSVGTTPGARTNRRSTFRVTAATVSSTSRAAIHAIEPTANVAPPSGRGSDGQTVADGQRRAPGRADRWFA